MAPKPKTFHSTIRHLEHAFEMLHDGSNIDEETLLFSIEKYLMERQSNAWGVYVSDVKTLFPLYFYREALMKKYIIYSLGALFVLYADKVEVVPATKGVVDEFPTSDPRRCVVQKLLESDGFSELVKSEWSRMEGGYFPDLAAEKEKR